MAARTDFVTGMAKRRYFHELLDMEIERIERYPHPITVVYMDMDDFKQVNDLFGHRVGDEVLCWIARALRMQLRKTDVVARLGGDEFGLLLTFTHLLEAKVVIFKLRARLMAEMRQRNWPVTFSMGVVVCAAPPHTAEQIIDRADGLMYEVKNSTKNDVRFSLWEEKSCLLADENGVDRRAFVSGGGGVVDDGQAEAPVDRPVMSAVWRAALIGQAGLPLPAQVVICDSRGMLLRKRDNVRVEAELLQTPGFLLTQALTRTA